MKKLFAVAALSFALAACSAQESGDEMPLGDPGYEEELMAQLLDAQPGDVITIPESSQIRFKPNIEQESVHDQTSLFDIFIFGAVLPSSKSCEPKDTTLVSLLFGA